MAKSSRKSKEAAGTVTNRATLDPEIQINSGTGRPRKQVVAKSAAAKPGKAVGRAKPAATRKPRAASTRNSGSGKTTISDEDIRIRAYFIAERRTRERIPGDSAQDWLEGRRQLQEEAGKRA